MNYATANDSELAAEIRSELIHANDEAFGRMLEAMRDAGLDRRRVRDCMMEVWRSLETKDHDEELHRLSNWLDHVEGKGYPRNPIWPGRMS